VSSPGDEPWVCPSGCGLPVEEHSLALALQHILGDELSEEEAEAVQARVLARLEAAGPVIADVAARIAAVLGQEEGPPAR
jgi:hypothetical protein